MPRYRTTTQAKEDLQLTAQPDGRGSSLVAYAATIFVGSFLLFLIQPVIARYILPWFGGTPALWTTCMLFFQAALLAGYGYAHFIQQSAAPRRQAIVHLTLLLISLAFLPIEPSEAWKRTGEADPIATILGLLAVTIGVPYLLLASTSPLLQHWFTRTDPGRSPYRLFALSNLGSLLGLLAYPFLIERLLTLKQQTMVWTSGYVLYLLLCAWCAFRVFRLKDAPASESKTTAEKAQPPLWQHRVLWFTLPAIASVALLATTNQICQNLAVVPMLWILPLGLYLVSFIICFDHARWYDRRIWIPLHFAAIVGVTFTLHHQVTGDLDIILLIMIFTSAMFVWCMVCHGEMVRLKPDPQYLTSFYLLIAAGGAGGGLFVTVLAPRLFSDYWEYQLTVFLAFALVGIALLGKIQWQKKISLLPIRIGWSAGAVVLAAALYLQMEYYDDDATETRRNFYGVLRVYEEEIHWTPILAAFGRQSTRVANPILRTLYSGEIIHGNQYLHPVLGRHATTYFGQNTGAGFAIRHHSKRSGKTGSTNLKIGAIGLGAGTLAAHLRPGDYLRFYEINSDVIGLNQKYFTYLKDSRGKTEAVLGDGRIRLEQDLAAEGPGTFDLIVLDAFSGDAIPIHLLTLEAFELYFRHLKPGGVLAAHISNRHLDLAPVFKAAARAMNKDVILTISPDIEDIVDASDWMLMTSDRAFLHQATVRITTDTDFPGDDRAILWTDDYSSLAGLFY